MSILVCFGFEFLLVGRGLFSQVLCFVDRSRSGEERLQRIKEPMQIDDMDFALNLSLYLTRLTKKAIIFTTSNNLAYIDLSCTSDISESKILTEYKTESKLQANVTRCCNMSYLMNRTT